VKSYLNLKIITNLSYLGMATQRGGNRFRYPIPTVVDLDQKCRRGQSNIILRSLDSIISIMLQKITSLTEHLLSLV